MSPLQTTQQVLKWLRIRPIDPDEKSWKNLYYAIFTFTIFTIEVLGIAGTAVFIWKHFRTDLEACLYALFSVTGACGAIYMCIVAFYLRNKITALFESLSKIYDARKTRFKNVF